MKKLRKLLTITALAISISACSGSESSTQNVVEIEEKNGFNEATNNKLELGPMTFSIPSYYKERTARSMPRFISKEYEYRGDTPESVVTFQMVDGEIFDHDAAYDIIDKMLIQIGSDEESDIITEILDHERSYIVKRTGKIKSDDCKTIWYAIYNGKNLYFIGTVNSFADENVFDGDIEKMVFSGVNSDKSKTNGLKNGINQFTSENNSGDFYALMDKYEKFFDEYIDIARKAKENPSDLTILSDYGKYMTDYVDMMKEFDAIGDRDLTDDERKYYIEVQLRIDQKLLELAE